MEDEVITEMVTFGAALDRAMNSPGIGPEGCTPYEDAAYRLILEGYCKAN